MSTPLRFVDAERLDTSAGALADTVLISPSDKRLGKLDGVVVNPGQRQVCFYVVRSDGWFRTQRYLVPAIQAQVEPELGGLRLDVEPEDLSDLPEMDPHTYPPFSDDDVVDAMFAQRPQ